MLVRSFLRGYRDVLGGPWCILGKGPSFGRWKQAKLKNYTTFALNDTAVIYPQATFAHFTDWDAYMRCSSALQGYSGRLVLPWHPHISNRPNRRTLDDWLRQELLLAMHAEDGRLLSYNSTLGPTDHPDLPKVCVRAFSAVAAFNLLALTGAKQVYSLGVDGGNGYSEEFDRSTCLSNGQPSFDAQQCEIERTLKNNKIEWIPL